MAIVAKPFAVGDLVRWASSSLGVWRHHVGVIVAVVPAGELPHEHVPAGRWSWHCRDNAPRGETSYLIALKDGGHGVGKLYRPRVRHLRHFSAGGPVLEVRRRSAKGYRPGYDYAVTVHPYQFPHVSRAPAGEHLANGATFRPRVESRALVLYKPRRSRSRSRWRRAALAAAWVANAALFAVLVVGLFTLFPA